MPVRSEILSALNKRTRGQGDAGREVRAFVGFDGFVDTLYRVVREQTPRGAAFFATIGEFAAHLGKAAGQSADMELVRLETRLGGNAPLMGNAMASLGVEAACVGAMGHPELRPVFASMHPRCSAVSIGEPGDTSAYEFDDGKLMFADLAPLMALDWARVKQALGPDALAAATAAELLALVNWGGLPYAQEIWEGLAAEVLPYLPPPPAGRARWLFVDLADISKRSSDDIQRLVTLLRLLSRTLDVTLGLNEHEAWILHARLAGPGGLHAQGDDVQGLGRVAEQLFELLGLSTIVIHPVNRSYAVSRGGLIQRPGRVVEKPRVSTGGGDNFNAGYCFARLLGLTLPASLECAMAVGRLYVREGRSPSMEELTAEIERLPER